MAHMVPYITSGRFLGTLQFLDFGFRIWGLGLRSADQKLSLILSLHDLGML